MCGLGWFSSIVKMPVPLCRDCYDNAVSAPVSFLNPL